MHTYRWPILLFLFVVYTMASCTKKADGIIGPTGPPGPAGASSQVNPSAITGYVNLVDQYGIPYTDYSGATVTTLKGDTLISSNTDNTGKFELPALPPGNYDILFKKSGYDSLKVYVQHSAGNEDKFIGIVKINEHVATNILSESTSLIQDAFYMYDSILSVQFIINFDGPAMTSTTRRDFAMYFSHSAQVSSSHADIFINTLGYSTNTGTNSYTFQYSLANFSARGISYLHNDTVYVKTYVIPVNGTATSWFDYISDQNIAYPYPGDSTLTYFIWQ
jgi:hypothetical protein